MKKLLIILTFLLPTTCFGTRGWLMEEYSILIGQQSRFGQPTLFCIDLQYDKCIRTCIMRASNYGFGLNYNLNQNHTELGIKGMINPTYYTLGINRKNRFFPYLYGQVNLVQTKSKVPITNGDILIKQIRYRPGLGLTGISRINEYLSFRSSLQLGYNIQNNKNQSGKNAMVFEYKVGFGLNARKVKANRAKKMETETKQPIQFESN